MIETGGDTVVYADSDIHCLAPFHGMFTWPAEPCNCVFMEDIYNSYSARVGQLAPIGSLKLIRKLNAGLYMFRKGAFDCDYMEWYFSRFGPAWQTYFGRLEQTFWAALPGALAVGCGKPIKCNSFWKTCSQPRHALLRTL